MAEGLAACVDELATTTAPTYKKTLQGVRGFEDHGLVPAEKMFPFGTHLPASFSPLDTYHLYRVHHKHHVLCHSGSLLKSKNCYANQIWFVFHPSAVLLALSRRRTYGNG